MSLRVFDTFGGYPTQGAVSEAPGLAAPTCTSPRAPPPLRASHPGPVTRWTRSQSCCPSCPASEVERPPLRACHHSYSSWKCNSSLQGMTSCFCHYSIHKCSSFHQGMSEVFDLLIHTYKTILLCYTLLSFSLYNPYSKCSKQRAYKNQCWT